MQLPPSARGLAALPAEALPDPVRAELLRRAAAARAADSVVDGGYLYQPTVAAARARSLRDALPAWAKICFAVKANGFRPVLEALAAEVDGFEVASAAEAAVARELAPGGLLLAAGPAKSAPLLRALVEQRVDVVTAESVLELRRLGAVAAAAGRVVDVAVRVNPTWATASGHLTMGGVASPFGVPEAELGEALGVAASLSSLRVAGIHVHAVSGVMDAAAYAEHVARCLALAADAAVRHGLDLRLVDVGGGIGVEFDGGPDFDLARFGELAAGLRPPAGVDVVLEPGRYLAAECGFYAAEVVDVKHSGGRAFALLRGGINHFQLPASWDLVHRFAVLPVDGWPHPWPRPEVRDGLVTVAGELCTPEDTLAVDQHVPSLRAGDVVVFPRAGAYGYEFAMPAFLAHPPATRVALEALEAAGELPVRDVGGEGAELGAGGGGVVRDDGGAEGG